MDIPALSANMATIDLGTKVGVILTKQILETAEANNQQQLEMLTTTTPATPAPHPTLGNTIDLKG